MKIGKFNYLTELEKYCNAYFLVACYNIINYCIFMHGNTLGFIIVTGNN